jgi:transcriptional regulator with XRE-family HTH domain
MAEDPTTNPAPQAPRQEKLQLTWDGQPASAGTAAGQPGVAPVRAEPVKPEPHFPVLPKSSPFRTPAGAAATEPRRMDSAPTVQAATAPATPPHLVNKLRTVSRALRDARESRQYSIAQVSQKTKIPREFIENIENQAVAGLPKPVYTKSYIRQLCREYGLDAAPLLEEYRLATEGGTTAPEGAAKFDPNRKDTTTGMRNGPAPRPRPTTTEEQSIMKKFSPSLVAVIIVVLGLIALALVISGLSKGSKTAGSTGGKTAPTVDMTQPAYVTPRELPVHELPVPSSPAPTAPVAPVVPAAPAP